MENDELEGVLNELTCIPADPPTKREQCLRCRRPQTVCWCPFLPSEPLQIKSTVVILQHPGEEKRCLRTAPMLEFALPTKNFLLYRGRRFSSGTTYVLFDIEVNEGTGTSYIMFSKGIQQLSLGVGYINVLEGPQSDEKLKSIFSSPNTILFYPGPEAVGLETLPKVNENCTPYNIIILDGTWPQAKSLYSNCDELKKIKQVQINSKVASEYVIRTQPTEKALSTVETAAVALSTLENQPYFKEVLLQPLKALCGFQLAHGALTHQSKEFLIKNGLHKSQNKLYFPQKEYLL